MFGAKLRVVREDGFVITLRPYTKSEIENIADPMSSSLVSIYTGGLSGKTEEDQREWFDKIRQDKNGYVWAIVPDGCDKPVGTTSINNLDNVLFSCSTGIIIYDLVWQSRGIRKLSHLGRTWFASDVLNRSSIHTHIINGNEPSQRALESVGYFVTGKYLRGMYRPDLVLGQDFIPHGVYNDTLVFTWLNPERIGILYPEGLPAEYFEGVERARVALARARQLVQLI